MRIASLVLLCMLATLVLQLAAEDYDDVLAATDRKDANSLYNLALWCQENQLHRKARAHFKEVIQLEPDHQSAREALGFVWYDDKWTHVSRVPGARTKPEPGAKRADVAGPPPTADQVDWDFTMPPFHVEGVDQWLEQFTTAMNSPDIWSGDVEVAINTLIMPDYVNSAAAAIAAAYESGRLKQIYGPSMVMQKLATSDNPQHIQEARRMLPFIVRASSKVNDGQQLYNFALAVGMLGDKRVVPRLIEILGVAGDGADGARGAISMITGIPEDKVTESEAQKWWDKWHAASASEVFGERLESDDPEVRLMACEQLYAEQDRRIVPVLIEVLKSPEMSVRLRAVALLQQITGNDWGLASTELDPKDQAEKLERLEDWWKEEGNRFVFIEFREALNRPKPAVKVDPTESKIAELTSTDTATARSARDWLVKQGTAAAPKLVVKLSSDDGILRQKVVEVLREVSGQQFGFDPILGSDEDRAAAAQRWQEWVENATAPAE